MSDTEDHPCPIKDEDDREVTPGRMSGIEVPSGVMHHNTSFMESLPVRNTPFNPEMMSDLNPQHPFNDPSGLTVHTSGPGMNMVPSPHDHQGGSRRPSMIDTFSSPVTSMYNQGWGPPSATQNNSMYPYGSQPEMDNGGFVSPGVAVNPGQSFMTASFDPNQSGMFRTPDMGGGGGHGDGSGGYDNYLTTDSRATMGQHM